MTARANNGHTAAWIIVAAIGLYLLAASTRHLLPPLSPFDAKRVLELIVTAIAIALTLAHPRLRDEFGRVAGAIPPVILLLFALLMGIGLASAALQPAGIRAQIYSLLDIHLLLLIATMVLVVTCCRRVIGSAFDRAAMLIAATVLAAVAFQESIGIAVYWSSGHQFSYDNALTHFAHPRFFNQMQTWFLPLLTAMPLLLGRRPLVYALAVLILGFMWFILVLTGARGSVLSIVVALGVVFIWLPAFRRPLLTTQLPAVILGLGLYGLMYLGPEAGSEPVWESTPVTPPIASAQHDGGSGAGEQTGHDTLFRKSLGRGLTHTTGRTRLWNDARRHIDEHPWLGLGPMGFACQGPSGREGSPHNFGLQIISEWGIPAGVVGLLLLLALGLRTIRAVRTRARETGTTGAVLSAALAASLIAAAIHSNASGLLITPLSQVTGMLVGGWALGLFAAPAESDSEPRHARWAIPLLCLVLLANVAASTFAQRELAAMESMRTELTHRDDFWPRYWQAGKVCRL